jgi:hypothetical protein
MQGSRQSGFKELFIFSSQKNGKSQRTTMAISDSCSVTYTIGLGVFASTAKSLGFCFGEKKINTNKKIWLFAWGKHNGVPTRTTHSRAVGHY